MGQGEDPLLIRKIYDLGKNIANYLIEIFITNHDAKLNSGALDHNIWLWNLN